MKRIVIGPSKKSVKQLDQCSGQAVSHTESKIAATVEKVIETQHYHTTVIQRDSKDRRARKHSLLAAKRNAAQLDEMCETLNEQNEIARATRRGIHSMVEQMDALKAELTILKAQKPVEIHTVTKEIVLTPQPQNKLVVAGVILSIVLSILALLK